VAVEAITIANHPAEHVFLRHRCSATLVLEALVSG
jgi:hypothetical protein